MADWTVSEAKARLSEVLRRSETEGPQRIGARRRYVVIPEAQWAETQKPRIPLGKWLIENMPCGVDLPLPDRNEPDRRTPNFDDPEYG